MPIGHVATVSQIVSDREVLISHSNWSLINGHRGQIERNVRAVDVSDAGDWSKVRVWYAPLGGLGTSSYPLFGFIYNKPKAPLTCGAAKEVPENKPYELPAPAVKTSFP